MLDCGHKCMNCIHDHAYTVMHACTCMHAIIMIVSLLHVSIYSQYGIYSTVIVNGPLCEIIKRDHQIKNVDTLGGDPRVKYIYSPGIELNPPVK